MDSTAIIIAVGGTLIFFGVLIWKGLWLLRKMQEEPPEDGEENKAEGPGN